MTPGNDAAIAETVAAFLLLAALIAVASGAVALFLVVRSRCRRDLPKRRRSHPRPTTPDPWTEAGRRLDPDPPDDDTDNDDEDDDGGGEPTPPVPATPSLANQC
ncbi:MAG: hypothetical protein ACTS22_01550 [Phycisphaerales bacterium]